MNNNISKQNNEILCGQTALNESKLSINVKELIIELFKQDIDLKLTYIEDPSIRLLEEISEPEQKAAVKEFVERFKKAKHKIKKSRPGYFRGVCQKYWKQNRERQKQELLLEAQKNQKNNVYSIIYIILYIICVLFILIFFIYIFNIYIILI